MNRWKSLTARCQKPLQCSSVPPTDKILFPLETKGCTRAPDICSLENFAETVEGTSSYAHPPACTVPLQEVAGSAQWRGLVDGYLADALVSMKNSDISSVSRYPETRSCTTRNVFKVVKLSPPTSLRQALNHLDTHAWTPGEKDTPQTSTT